VPDVARGKRQQEIGENKRPFSGLLGCWLVCHQIYVGCGEEGMNRFHTRGLLIVLMIEAARTSETLVNFYQTTWCYNPEDSHLHTLRRENLKSYLPLKPCAGGSHRW
jgi:hypothetical protein